MDPNYAARYRDLHERHWWWRAREEVVEGVLRRHAPEGGWRRALDVGCGDGLHFPLLLRYADEVDGVEPDEGLLTAVGRERSGGTIHVCPFDASFQPGHTYDLMVFLDVLEHMDDPEGAVRHAATLLEPGGVVVVTVPAHMHLWTTHDDLNHHVTRYSAGRLRRLLETAFEVERVRHLFRWVHGAKLVQKGMEALTRPEPAAPAVPPAPVNRFFHAASRMEEATLSWLPLPIGSSLLAVARKR